MWICSSRWPPSFSISLADWSSSSSKVSKQSKWFYLEVKQRACDSHDVAWLKSYKPWSWFILWQTTVFDQSLTESSLCLSRYQACQRIHYCHWGGEAGRSGTRPVLQFNDNRSAFTRYGQGFPPLWFIVCTFSQPFREKCMGDVVRIGSITILHPSKLWEAKYHIVWCNISGEATGEIWYWSLLGWVEGLNALRKWIIKRTQSQHMGTAVKINHCKYKYKCFRSRDEVQGIR